MGSGAAPPTRLCVAMPPIADEFDCRFNDLMDLSAININEVPGRYESLALALQAVAQAAGETLDYDAICAAMGVSFAAVSVRSEAAPGWWMTYGRDAFIEPTAQLFGIRLRNVQPTDVGVEMTTAVEFPQHFVASYKPLVSAAVDNGQPVLAWQGWPGSSGRFWGVVTAVLDDELQGVTLWAEGQRVPLVAPAMQCYVVEQCEPRLPPRNQLLATAIRHADACLNRAPYAPVVPGGERACIVTGPAAFDAWEDWLTTGEFGGPDVDPSWSEHRQHAEFIVSGRQSAAAFLQSIREIVPADEQDLVEQILGCCSSVVEHLGPACDANTARAQFATPDGRQTLLSAVHRAEAADRRMAILIEEWKSNQDRVVVDEDPG